MGGRTGESREAGVGFAIRYHIIKKWKDLRVPINECFMYYDSLWNVAGLLL